MIICICKFYFAGRWLFIPFPFVAARRRDPPCEEHQGAQGGDEFGRPLKTMARRDKTWKIWPILTIHYICLAGYGTICCWITDQPRFEEGGSFFAGSNFLLKARIRFVHACSGAFAMNVNGKNKYCNIFGLTDFFIQLGQSRPSAGKA